MSVKDFAEAQSSDISKFLHGEKLDGLDTFRRTFGQQITEHIRVKERRAYRSSLASASSSLNDFEPQSAGAFNVVRRTRFRTRSPVSSERMRCCPLPIRQGGDASLGGSLS